MEKLATGFKPTADERMQSDARFVSVVGTIIVVIGGIVGIAGILGLLRAMAEGEGWPLAWSAVIAVSGFMQVAFGAAMRIFSHMAIMIQEIARK